MVNNIIAVWGSPGSGTTTTSVKIARELAEFKKNVVLIFCDNETPMLPVLDPSIRDAKSLGDLLELPSISQIDIYMHLTSIWKTLSVLGYLNGENELSHARYSEDRASELLDLISDSADYVVLDCSHHLLTNNLTGIALEKAGVVLRVVNADPKSLSYIKSQKPLLSDQKFSYDQQICIINDVFPDQDAQIYENAFGGRSTYTLPHLPGLHNQFWEARLLESLKGREGRLYEPQIRAITLTEILSDQFSAVPETAIPGPVMP